MEKKDYSGINGDDNDFTILCVLHESRAMLIWLVLCAVVGVLYNFGCPVQLWVSSTGVPVAFLCIDRENLYNLSVTHLPLLAFLAPPPLRPRQLCMTHSGCFIFVEVKNGDNY